MIRRFSAGFARILTLGCTLALLIDTPAQAGDTQRQITVTGEGQVAATPDMATISMGVTFEAETARSAMDATSAATGEMLQQLADLGIESRDMQTSSLTLNPIWADRSSSASKKRGITGFVANNSVHVRLRDLSILGLVLDSVIDDGANNFNGLQFSVQDPDPLANGARQRAVADAIAKAQLLTQAANVSLGPVLSISEHGGVRPQMLERSAARGGNVPIAAGEVTVSATVTMVFAIEN